MSSPKSRTLYHLNRAIEAALDRDDPDPVEPELVEQLRALSADLKLECAPTEPR